MIVTHDPDSGFPRRLRLTADQVDCIVIVDNASGLEGQAVLADLDSTPRPETIQNPENLGIATGLNLGIERARGRGYLWVLALDQDSEPSPDMVPHLANALQNLGSTQNVAIVAAQTIDSARRRPTPFLRRRVGFLYERSQCRGEVMQVTTAISSGSLLNVGVHEKLGGFREDYFMDYVDTEYCLRAQLGGFRILAACRAKLYHQLGNRRELKLGPLRLFPTFYGPARWYTISRNRIPTWRGYALRFPHWLFYEVVASVFVTLRMIVTESDRARKFRAILKGTWDGLLGRMGPPPSQFGFRDEEANVGLLTISQ